MTISTSEGLEGGKRCISACEGLAVPTPLRKKGPKKENREGEVHRAPFSRKACGLRVAFLGNRGKGAAGQKSAAAQGVALSGRGVTGGPDRLIRGEGLWCPVKQRCSLG